MLGDDETTVGELKSAIQTFAEARDWMQFHDPKNLVMAMASEIGELSDHFRWLRSGESSELLKDPRAKSEIASELADVVMFALEFANVCEIDVATAFREKLQLNEQRYPIEKAKGTAEKYDRL